MNDYETLKCRPCAQKNAEVKKGNCRFTVLTPRLIRLEYSESGLFEDSATQVVLNREFPVPPFGVDETDGRLVLKTGALTLTCRPGQPFSASSLQIKVEGNYSLHHSVWHYGETPDDLRGTARTLDNSEGPIPLGHGIQSREGWSLLDDSASLLLTGDGWVRPRPEGETTDLYFFGYGHDYLKCLGDFYRLTGSTPLLPRFALGNWWSRYHRYTAQEYSDLMDRFRREELPFTVAVVDMDWHLTEVDPRYGTGWTGYTWNRKLFPEPEAFLSKLHRKGMRVALNLHPADGIRPFEECYPKLAEAVGADPEKKETVPFDASSRKFLRAWADCALHPLEEEGVDVWWIDWQQGTCCDMPGLDPLWILNHVCYLDGKRKGGYPLTLSRYAGPGGHRYPIGFSGDTVISWKTLAFQPYFTATAANIGYGWWSHDIGGHMNGVRDDELAVRWLQFGAFSPILRLHSSASPFNGKDPGRYGAEAEQAMKEFLRLRHRMIPYLYTMNRLSHRDGVPLILPMYYRWPESWDAYEVPNEYSFGTQLIACPITEPMDRSLKTAKFRGWLPEGTWYDFFTGMRYSGGHRIDFYRPLERIPVFAKAGGIVPLSLQTGNSPDNPKALEIRVFAGADGDFRLYEDDGAAGDEDALWAETPMTFRWGPQAEFEVGPVAGNAAALPKKRDYAVVFTGVCETPASVTLDGADVPFRTSYDSKTGSLSVRVEGIPVRSGLKIVLHGASQADNPALPLIWEFLNRAQIPYARKDAVSGCLKGLENSRTLPFVLESLLALGLSPELLGNICEFLLN